MQAAREMGDLSENAEYDSAKDEQTVIETEIAEIEHKLRTSKIIEENEIDTSKVSIGCLVKFWIWSSMKNLNTRLLVLLKVTLKIDSSVMNRQLVLHC